MDEYKFDYGALHPPYQRDDGEKRLTEVLHPVFVKRLSGPLRIGHVTDTHVDVRADVYEANLEGGTGEADPQERVSSTTTTGISSRSTARPGRSPTWSC